MNNAQREVLVGQLLAKASASQHLAEKEMFLNRAEHLIRELGIDVDQMVAEAKEPWLTRPVEQSKFTTVRWYGREWSVAPESLEAGS